MPSTSNTPAYYAQTSRKPEHHYTSYPPTTHPADQKSLQAYRLSSYKQDSHRPPLASSQTAAHIEAAHQARVGQQTDAILAQFYQR